MQAVALGQIARRDQRRTSLVIDDPQPTIGRPVDPVDVAAQPQARSPGRLQDERRPVSQPEGQLLRQRDVLPRGLDQPLERAPQHLGQLRLLVLPECRRTEAVVLGRRGVDLTRNSRQPGAQPIRVAVGHALVEPLQHRVIDRAQGQHIEAGLGRLARLKFQDVGRPEIERAPGIGLQPAAGPGLIRAVSPPQLIRQRREIAVPG